MFAGLLQRLHTINGHKTIHPSKTNLFRVSLSSIKKSDPRLRLKLRIRVLRLLAILHYRATRATRAYVQARDHNGVRSLAVDIKLCNSILHGT